MSTPVRVRFAPSPTGPLHIGGLRTALFNYLFARKHKGTFILRIEDTDQTRFVPGAQQYIIDALNWCGIPYDEGPNKEGDLGPYLQSERKSIYKQYAQDLINKGAAYYAFDTSADLQQARKTAESQKQTFIYNHQTRNGFINSLTLPATEVQNRIDRGDDYVVRFKPELKTLHLYDQVRKDITINTELLDDKILFKSDGMPTYHLANVVDDHLMQITHVIRGEEWLPSMALHVLLYQSFEWDTPQFAHLPLILKPTGKGKLSKRDGAKMGFPVFPMQWTDSLENETYNGYKEDGYMPEALINMLALLGWNPGTEQELFDLESLINTFSLDKVNSSGAKFDPEKTQWFQQQWFVKQNDAAIGQLFTPILKQKGINYGSQDYVNIVCGLVKERAVFAHDLLELAGFFFESPTDYDSNAAAKAWKQETPAIMTDLISIIEQCTEDTATGISKCVKDWITKHNIGFGKVMMPLRLALVGSLMGPDVFEIAGLLGKQETIKRIQNAIATLS